MVVRYYLPGSFLLRMQRDPLGYLLGLRRRYGEVVHVRNGSRHVFLFSSPELVREVLVTRARSFVKGRGLQLARRVLGDGLLTSEDERHQEQRRLTQQGFQRERVAAFGPVMVDCTRALGWRAGQVVDCGEEMHRLSLDIVGRTLFDAEFSAQARVLAGVLNQGRRMFRWGYLLFPIFERLERLLPPVRWLVARNRRRVDAALEPVIRAHRRRPREDLLSMLIESGMSDEWVRDQAVTLLLAGIETTANALAWTLHLLALHRHRQQAVREELGTVLGGRPPEAGDLGRLPVLESVLLESLRLYPPNWMISRIAREDVAIGDRVVPAGATCLVSQYVIHRDERWFPSPELFDPSRWERAPRASLPRYAYFPFGGGSRMCVGEHFALLEAMLVLATLLQQWELLAVEGRRVAADPGITLRPLPGPRLRVR